MQYKKNAKEDNFLLNIPVKNHNNWMHKDNVVYLVFRKDKPLERLFAWITGKPTARDIRFERLGTKVWQLIDGSNTVLRIGQILLKEYGGSCQPVYERLFAYLRYLNKKGWIKFKNSSKSKTFTINKA